MKRKILAAAALVAFALLAVPVARQMVTSAQGQVSCPTALPPAGNFTGGSVTESQFKTATTNLVAYLTCLFGTDGTVATLKSTLGLSTVAFSGSYLDLSNTPASLPPGVIVPYGGSSAPTGYLMANGQAVSRTTFAPLFAIYSTTYGVGDGSTTFNLPDLRGRGIFGADNMGGASAANRLQVSTNLTTTSGSTAATVASATGIAAGMVITVTSVSGGTTVSSVNGTAVTLSANATATGTNAARFSALGDAQALGQAGGAISHVQGANELVSHNHGSGALAASSSGSGSFTTGDGAGGSALPVSALGSVNGTAGVSVSVSTSISGNTAATGNGAAMTITPPGMVLNWIVKTSGKRLAPANDNRWALARTI
jgi:microcystin-dependent protein